MKVLAANSPAPTLEILLYTSLWVFQAEANIPIIPFLIHMIILRNALWICNRQGSSEKGNFQIDDNSNFIKLQSVFETTKRTHLVGLLKWFQTCTVQIERDIK